jgi:S-adenosylmethionine hydrolase
VNLKPLIAALAFAALPLAASAEPSAEPAKSPVIFYTDFGTRDGALAAMKGVVYGLAPDLPVEDLSHENPSDIFEGAYRLYQTAPFWPKGSVFVTVIDPGVGTERLSIVLKTKAGHYFVGPDNGLFTLIAEEEGIAGVRQIDEKTNRRPGSEKSHTFHGRDVFAYTGAKLAAGKITFEQVGPEISAARLVKVNYQKPAKKGDALTGMIPVLDVNYGNVWSNIPQDMFDGLKVKNGEKVRVRTFHNGKLVDDLIAPYVHTFGNVPVGEPLVYINSLMNVAVALNQGNYAAAKKIESGEGWTMEVSKAK